MNVGDGLVRWPVATGLGLELVLTVASVTGFFMLGTGLLLIGHCGVGPNHCKACGGPWPRPCYLWEVAWLLWGLWLTPGNEHLLLQDAFIVVITHIVMWPLMILLYFRVLYRRPLDAGCARIDREMLATGRRAD